MINALACTNPRHDHIAYDESGSAVANTVAKCMHCKNGMHYDGVIEDFQHDDAATPDCFLITRDDDAEPCTFDMCATCGNSIDETYNPETACHYANAASDVIVAWTCSAACGTAYASNR